MQATQLVVPATQASSSSAPSSSGAGGGSGGGGRSRKQVFVKAESEKKEAAVKEGKDGSVEKELNVSKVSVNEFKSSKPDKGRILTSLPAGRNLTALKVDTSKLFL